MNPYSAALLGGVLIGIAASLLLFFRGRIFGISGIIGGLVKPQTGESAWRIAVVLGLLSGGLIASQVFPAAFPSVEAHPLRMIVAGLLVGFGTQLGSGCTSGHGVCGMSRFSPRSIVATLTFIVSGVVTVTLISMLEGY